MRWAFDEWSQPCHNLVQSSMLDYSVSLYPGWLWHYSVLDWEAKILEYIITFQYSSQGKFHAVTEQPQSLTKI